MHQVFKNKAQRCSTPLRAYFGIHVLHSSEFTSHKEFIGLPITVAYHLPHGKRSWNKILESCRWRILFLVAWIYMDSHRGILEKSTDSCKIQCNIEEFNTDVNLSFYSTYYYTNWTQIFTHQWHRKHSTPCHIMLCKLQFYFVVMFHVNPNGFSQV